MAEEALVESSVTDSVKLVKELDKQGDTPSNVLWYFFSDAEVWRLLVAGRRLQPPARGHHDKISTRAPRLKRNVKPTGCACGALIARQADTPLSDASRMPVRRQFVKRIAGDEILVGWRSGAEQAATEGTHVPPTSPRRCV